MFWLRNKKTNFQLHTLIHYSYTWPKLLKLWYALLINSMRWEHSGSVVECLTRDQGVEGSSLASIYALFPWARHINPSLVLVQPRMTCPYIIERLLMGHNESNQIKTVWAFLAFIFGWPEVIKNTHAQLSWALNFHNICFGWEIRKLIFNYALLSIIAIHGQNFWSFDMHCWLTVWDGSTVAQW